MTTHLKNVPMAHGSSEAANTAAEVTRVAGATGAGAKAERVTVLPRSGVGPDLERTTMSAGVGHGIARNDVTEVDMKVDDASRLHEAEKGRRHLLDSVL